MAKFEMTLQIPTFKPCYDDNTEYGYKGEKGDNLKSLLEKTSNGYCMYCYTKVDVDSKRFGQLEHSIEKRHCTKLYECVPNIALACSKCNLSFKKKGDTEKVFTVKRLENFRVASCNKEKCKNECREYKELKKVYLKKRKIILQPFGISKGKKEFRIQYNLMNLQFEPSEKWDYTDEEKEFINAHIGRFCLNDPDYRTRELLQFCEDVVNGDQSFRRGKYNNMIVDLFMDKIAGWDRKKICDLCSLIYSIGVVNNMI